MKLYYAGFNASLLFSKDDGTTMTAIDRFTEIPFVGITDFEIGWNYFLLWRDKDLYVVGKFDENDSDVDDSKKQPQLLRIPESSTGCRQAVAGKESVTILSTKNDLWRYLIYEKRWKKVTNFIPSNDDAELEYIVKLSQGGCTVALSNLGRVFVIPTLVEIPKRIKFVDIACGFDHTVMLADNGDIYTMGMGTRGQLGHGDLEDCDNPRLVEALAGLKVVQISAAGWHSAVITNQGDLYAWGWDTHGELGITGEDSKVLAVPTVVDFKNEAEDSLEVIAKKVQCGNVFTICMLEDGTLWGCGSNKYGQLGLPRKDFVSSKSFVKLKLDLDEKSVESFTCREWGTVIVTDTDHLW